MSMSIVFLVAALVMFIFAAFNVPGPVNWVALGLACFVVAQIAARVLV